MTHLELRYTSVHPDWTPNTLHGVVPYLDGTSLIDLIVASGSDAPGPLITWSYPQQARGDGLIEVLDCVCTDHGCGGIDARVERIDGAVRWTEFLDPHGDQVEVGPFEFDPEQYDTEVARIDTELHRLVPTSSYVRHAVLREFNLVSTTRWLVGIAGAPGSGKSTTAADLASSLSDFVAAAVLPMDGFHLPQVELVRLGRRDRMGAPDTFDVDRFVATLERLRQPGAVTAPGFDREIEEPVPDAIEIGADIRIVIVEGNYLLHDRDGWERVRPLLDRVIFLAPDDAVRRGRLIARHVAFGKTPAEAEAWVARSDDANAALVAATAHRADDIVGEGAA